MAKKSIERRQHKRLPLACPIVLHDDGQSAAVKTKAVNVSNGGVYLTVPSKRVPSPGKRVTIKLRVPRSTPNTYMLEELTVQAQVIRHDIRPDNTKVGLAMKFATQQNLELEV